MSTTFALKREKLAEKILGKLGAWEPGASIPGDDLQVIVDAMDLRLKELHAAGVLWWKVAGASTSITLSGGVATAAIAPTDFLFPVTMRLLVGVDEREVEIVGHSEYHQITDKTSQGEPDRVFISGATCTFWPVPASGYTAKLTYQAIVNDSAINTAPDIPTGMQRAFIDVIAADLVDEFEIAEPKASRLFGKQAAGLEVIRALNQQRVDSVRVTPEYF